MSRSLLLSATAALFLALSGPAQSPAPKSAFDKAALEMYARHLWVLGPELKVVVLDPKPSADLPGFKEVTVRISQGTASQDAKLIVTNDGSKIIQGTVYDMNFNPFKPQLDKMKTQGQPSIGTPGATVVLVDFSDMQCPHCKDEAKMLREHLVQEYPTQVRLYYKDFPLSIHPWAKPAAIAGTPTAPVRGRSRIWAAPTSDPRGPPTASGSSSRPTTPIRTAGSLIST